MPLSPPATLAFSASASTAEWSNGDISVLLIGDTEESTPEQQRTTARSGPARV
jgi:hypothetical protein